MLYFYIVNYDAAINVRKWTHWPVMALKQQIHVVQR